MEAIELREKLHHYIENAGEKKLQAIFTMVEDEIKTSYNHWDNKDFVDEMMKREKSYLDGISKTYTIAESASRAREAIKNQQ